MTAEKLPRFVYEARQSFYKIHFFIHFSFLLFIFRVWRDTIR